MAAHVVANGTMSGQRYIDEVLLPHVRLFRGAVGDKFVFMDDNATCHRTLAVQDCLDSEGIQRLVWPARYPDLNPIENVWDALGRQVAGLNYPPTNKNTLIRALTVEWDKLPQQLLDNVVQSIFTCRNCGGGDRGRVAIYRPFGEFRRAKIALSIALVLKANDRRASCPCHDEFRGPRSDYVRQKGMKWTQKQAALRSSMSVSEATVECVRHSFRRNPKQTSEALCEL
ncbi:transposable element Tc1 transposase [Trichonephila clavipes]|nr:transposable element Tc1 transposase [Trichonephila clavipes]